MSSSSAHHAPNARKSASRLYQRARPGTHYTVAAREAEWLVALAENRYLAPMDFQGNAALLITGGPGVGKTELMLKLAALWEAAGAEILVYGYPGGALESPYEMVYTMAGLRPGEPGRRILLLDSGFVPNSNPAWSPYGPNRIYLDNGDRYGPLPGVHVIATAQVGPQWVRPVGVTGGSWRKAKHPMSPRLDWARMVEETWGLRAAVNIHLRSDGPPRKVSAILDRPGADLQEFSATDNDPWLACPR